MIKSILRVLSYLLYGPLAMLGLVSFIAYWLVYIVLSVLVFACFFYTLILGYDAFGNHDATSQALLWKPVVFMMVSGAGLMLLDNLRSALFGKRAPKAEPKAAAPAPYQPVTLPRSYPRRTVPTRR